MDKLATALQHMGIGAIALMVITAAVQASQVL